MARTAVITPLRTAIRRWPCMVGAPMCNSARRSTSATGRLLYAPAHPELVDALLAACVEWDYARWTAGMLADYRLAPFYRPHLGGGLPIG